MNPETKRFTPVTTDTPPDWPRVQVGQESIVCGIPCRVRKVTRKDIIMRPIKENDKVTP